MSDKTKKGMKCLSFQEPFATMIVTGAKTVECRSRNIKTPVKDLVVCASKTANVFSHIDGLAYGYAIGMVDVVDCVPFTEKHKKAAMMSMMPGPDDHAWILENPRMIVPQSVKASASFFYIDFTPQVIGNDLEMYIEHILPICWDSGDNEMKADVLYSFFGDQKLLWDLFEL